MTPPTTLMNANIITYPQYGATYYMFDGQFLWLPKYTPQLSQRLNQTGAKDE